MEKLRNKRLKSTGSLMVIEMSRRVWLSMEEQKQKSTSWKKES